ncbi:hypothetical protein N7492_003191 [Penicillium capsulatum]|uniref:Leucine-rich repeat domain-containing protein n=1 Tax=Penicillium capsulatum TaxID=69766 RepID=A0A9W9LVV9_9EURO|nr:hypothetical protein N7492_003191 [Penicillium capsulatum]KAJ6122221.1 hypothetical protein N7512_004686 [Penicillium capsulatum]
MDAILPNDILLLIGEQLPHRADRWSLIFVSRHFHELFLPSLYRCIHFHNWIAARSFFLSITTRPTLASAVRELDVSGWQPELTSDTEREDLRKWNPMRQAIQIYSHSVEEQVQWEDDLVKGLGDAWIALILPMLNQLRRVHLDLSAHTPILERVIKRAVFRERHSHTQTMLRYLRDVSLHRRDDIDHPDARRKSSNNQDSAGSAVLLSFFHLPSVRTIVASSVMDPSSVEGLEHTIENPRARVSPITEIDLRASSGNQGMEALIAPCANLLSFKYQHSDTHVLSQGYQPTAFHRALAGSKETLHTLWLDHYGDHYAFTAAGLNQSHDEWFGSLAEFTALRELRIRLPNLLDIRYQSEPSMSLVEVLPSSLETLFIEGCEERHMTMLGAQLQAVIKSRSRARNLRRVDIEGAFRNDPFDEFRESGGLPSGHPSGNFIREKIIQMAESLHIACAIAGAEFRLHDRALTQPSG